MEARLSYKEKELVAVGASIAAGCTPCTQYHLQEVKTAGATTAEIIAAIDAALCVKGSTRDIMEKIAYAALGVPKEEQPSCCSGPTDRMKELVSIAAAVAINCPTNFQKHVAASRTVGVREDEIQLVVGLAKMIRGKAVEKMDAAAKELSTPVQVEACCGPETTSKNAAQSQATTSICCGPAVNLETETQSPSALAGKGTCC